MIPAAVDYVRAGSIDEALAALATPDAKLLAGGQSLLPAMKLRIARPSLLVDVGGLEMSGVEERDGIATRSDDDHRSTESPTTTQATEDPPRHEPRHRQ